MRSLLVRADAPRAAAAANVFASLFASIFLITLSGLTLTGCGEGAKASGAKDRVARGQYLVNAGVCTDCHTPWKPGPGGPAPDPTRLLSGHPEDLKLATPGNLPEGWGRVMSETSTAFAGPWGISYAANLTPDDTGMGVWTEDMFIKAMRSGKHMGTGRDILPPMPWPNYANLTDEDLRAIFAYLRSIPPISNVVPEPTPPAVP